ncbi:MAG: DUF1800 domain-containing protein [Fimbriimonadaceae bacterium]
MSFRTERDRVAHLLRRFGLGSSEAEIDFYGEGGYAAAVDRLLAFESIDEGYDTSPDLFRTGDQNQLNPRQVQLWWIARLIVTKRPLQERLTVFWHDHFATSAAKVVQGPMMANHIEVLRSNAAGSFRSLLKATIQDPAMVFWLDNQFNVKGKPNENLAREIMELFTLGIGHYTEEDVKETARALTGWGLRRMRPNEPGANGRVAEFRFYPNQHDGGLKTIRGQTGPFDGEDVLNMLCDDPQTARHIVTKFWEWFVYPKPEPALVDRLAGGWRRNGLDIKALVREVALSTEFQSERAQRAVFKNPVDFAVAAVRQIGVGEPLRTALASSVDGRAPRLALAPVLTVQQSMRAMGMDLVYPPDVAGWETGPAWITSATMVERIGFADRLFGAIAPGSRRVQMRFPVFPLFAANPTPEGAARRLVSVFDAPMPESKMAGLFEAAAKAASGGRVTPQNANAVAAAVSRLIFGSPEFQMA